MLNELVDIFCGMYHYCMELLGFEDFALQAYFASVICVVITACLITGSFIIIACIVSETFKTIRGVTK